LCSQVTGSNKSVKVKIVRQREGAVLKPRGARYHAVQATEGLMNAGNGSLCAGFSLVAGYKDNMDSFKEAAALAGVSIMQRMSAVDGLELMSAASLSWSQYRMINSILLDKF
jgi:hypothetical protein